jgi:uncharacterized membrane protein
VITSDTSVRIERPIDHVFSFVSDPSQFPGWNSAIQTVQITSGATGEPGSTSMSQARVADCVLA